MRSVLISDEEIYRLRKEGMTYEQISQHFKDKGKKISISTVGNRCRAIDEESAKEGIEKPRIKYKSRNKREDISDKEIYELRQNGMTYGEIVRYFGANRRKISETLVRYRCKQIYQKRGEKEPRVKWKRTNKRKDISDEEICELREKGMSYRQIADWLKSDGRELSQASVRDRVKKAYEEKTRLNGKSITDANNTEPTLRDLESQLSTFEEKKKASGELVAQYEELQGVNEEKINSKEGVEK